MQAVDVAVEGGPADDLGVWAQSARVQGEVNIGVVIMGGDDDAGRCADAGLFKKIEVAGLAHHEARTALPLHAAVSVDNGTGNAAAVEAARHGQAHAAAAQDEGPFLRLRILVRAADEPVEGLELLLRAGHHEDGAFRENGVETGQAESAAFPDADHVDSREIFEVALLERLVHEGRAQDRGLADGDAPEVAKHAEPLARLDDPAAQRLAEKAVEVETAGTACHAQNVPGLDARHAGHDEEVGRGFPRGEDDVGTAHVRAQILVQGDKE